MLYVAYPCNCLGFYGFYRDAELDASMMLTVPLSSVTYTVAFQLSTSATSNTNCLYVMFCKENRQIRRRSFNLKCHYGSLYPQTFSNVSVSLCNEANILSYFKNYCLYFETYLNLNCYFHTHSYLFSKGSPL